VVRLQLFGGDEAATRSPIDLMSVFHKASQFQQQSTAFRLGNKVLTSENSALNRNIERANLTCQIVQEKRDKKDQYACTALGWVKIHVFVYKWAFDGMQTQKNKMVKVNTACLV
jgi:hypothetical protein